MQVHSDDTVKNKKHLTITRYMFRKCNIRRILPFVIEFLCAEFSATLVLRFSKEWAHTGWNFESDSTRIQTNPQFQSGYMAACLDLVIDIPRCLNNKPKQSKVEFEYILSNFVYYFNIGFVLAFKGTKSDGSDIYTPNMTERTFNNYIGSRDGILIVIFLNKSGILCVDTQKWKESGAKLSANSNGLVLPHNKTWKSGDRVGFSIDCEQRTCDFYYNGERVCRVFEDMPDYFIPALSLTYHSKESDIIDVRFGISKDKLVKQ